MDQRDENILVETEQYRITGTLRLPREGYRSRLTDYLNSSERAFLPLTNVEIGPRDGSAAAEQHDFLAVSLAHTIIVVPLDSGQNENR